MQSKFWRIPDLKQLECMKVQSSKHCFPRHWHETYVIEVIEEGRNGLWCNGKIYSADPNEIIVIHPGEIHTGYPSGMKALSYRSSYPSQELMVDLCRQVTGREYMPRFEWNIVRDKVLARMFGQAHRLLEVADNTRIGQSLMILALGELIARYSDPLATSQQGANLESIPFSFSQTRIQRTVDFLAEKYHENISLTELSRTCGLSEYHFLRTFKKFTGMAPYEYVVARRVEESRKLLSKGISIAEAAARTGFYDQSHLNRHFKRILGITPGKYVHPIG